MGFLPYVGYFRPYGAKITYMKKERTMLPQAEITFTQVLLHKEGS